MQKIIWIDEAWRWPWAWPVVAWVFVFLKKNLIINKLKDSKKLSKIKREEIYSELQILKKDWICLFEIWIIDSSIIDEIWIKKANKLAMEQALFKLFKKMKNIPKYLIQIDWKDNYIFENVENKVEFIVKWDDKIDEIKAASIVAKVFRDELMSEYDIKYPNYGFSRHAWYGTKIHQEAIKKLGICAIHRKSFAPIKNQLDFKTN